MKLNRKERELLGIVVSILQKLMDSRATPPSGKFLGRKVEN